MGTNRRHEHQDPSNEFLRQRKTNSSLSQRSKARPGRRERANHEGLPQRACSGHSPTVKARRLYVKRYAVFTYASTRDATVYDFREMCVCAGVQGRIRRGRNHGVPGQREGEVGFILKLRGRRLCGGVHHASCRRLALSWARSSLACRIIIFDTLSCHVKGVLSGLPCFRHFMAAPNCGCKMAFIGFRACLEDLFMKAVWNTANRSTIELALRYPPRVRWSYLLC